MFWLNRHQLMKQFLVLLVFTLGKEYRVRHRVLFVVLGVCSSLCSLCCGCSICVKKCSHNCARLCFREVSCVFANASIYGVFGYMMFIARLCARFISLWIPNVSEVDHAGHAYSRVGRTTVVYTVRRSSAGMPDRLSCSSFINVYVPGQVTGDGNAKYPRLGYSLSVCSVDAYGWEVCLCFREINNELFCLTFVDFHVILDCTQIRCIGCFLEIWLQIQNKRCTCHQHICRSRTLFEDHLS